MRLLVLEENVLDIELSESELNQVLKVMPMLDYAELPYSPKYEAVIYYEDMALFESAGLPYMNVLHEIYSLFMQMKGIYSIDFEDFTVFIREPDPRNILHFTFEEVNLPELNEVKRLYDQAFFS